MTLWTGSDTGPPTDDPLQIPFHEIHLCLEAFPTCLQAFCCSLDFQLLKKIASVAWVFWCLKLIWVNTSQVASDLVICQVVSLSSSYLHVALNVGLQWSQIWDGNVRIVIYAIYQHNPKPVGEYPRSSESNYRVCVVWAAEPQIQHSPATSPHSDTHTCFIYYTTDTHTQTS